MKKYENLLEIYARQVTYVPFHLSENLRVLYVLRGSVNCRWVAGVHTLSAGQIEIVNIKEPFCIEECSEDNLILFFEIGKEKAVEYYDLIDDGLYNCNTTLFYDSTTDQGAQKILKVKLQMLYWAYLREAAYSTIEKQVYEIVNFIGSNCHDLLNMLNAKRGTDSRADRFFRIYTYIYNHCEEKINLKQLADKEYVSQQYLSKEFNERLNMNFKDTLEYYRIIQSVRYLIEGQQTVTMVSELCGFSAPRYFYKHFVMYLKCTPVEFRNQYLTRAAYLKTIQIGDDEIRALIQNQCAETDEKDDKKDSILTVPAGYHQPIHCNKRKVTKNLVSSLADFLRQHLTEGMEVMLIPNYGTRNRIIELLQKEERREDTNTPPVILIVYTREGYARRPNGKNGFADFTRKIEMTGVSAYKLCQLAETKGLTCQLNFDILLQEEEARKILGADEQLHPLLAIIMGYKM
ncbi:MAG: helix-turn-helix transcriptional regulator [Firmicutes bacterium]|nr:helix-turn-helix transcriptional regulator [Bacillota bacterium]